MGHWPKAVYAAAGAADALRQQGDKAADDDVVKWLLR
jgi:hypothetical protein